MKLEKEFQLQAMANAQTAMLTYGCPTKRLLQTLEEHGGAETVRELAKRGRTSDGFNELFNELEMSVPHAQEEDYEVLRNSVNPDRLMNNPVSLDIETIDDLYHQILN